MIPDEHQALITAMASTFTDEKLRPHAVQWDREGNLDRSALREMAGLGLGGIYASAPFGGSALSRRDAALIFEHLSQGCISHAAFLSIHTMATWMMDAFGDDALRKKFVPKLTAGDMFASYCLTEPDAGSSSPAKS